MFWSEVIMLSIGMVVSIFLGIAIGSEGSMKRQVVRKGKRIYTRFVFSECQHKFALSINENLDDIKNVYEVVDIEYSSNEKGFSALIIMK
ncbi:hypothetical protein [Exiguobacterium oxidotolerans]|uniref:hypothetical protein n=1 Tax=Exiguobacterium oxidotolerans TaxID=223958 RepID=UPI0004941F2B|nr:hypothetical protein [Exiguobacterium oxidotolerans]